MIRIDLKLFVTLSKYYPPAKSEYEVETGATVAAIIQKLGIPEEEVKLIFINGRKAAPTDTVSDGDRVGLFPPVGGG